MPSNLTERSPLAVSFQQSFPYFSQKHLEKAVTAISLASIDFPSYSPIAILHLLRRGKLWVSLRESKVYKSDGTPVVVDGISDTSFTQIRDSINNTLLTGVGGGCNIFDYASKINGTTYNANLNFLVNSTFSYIYVGASFSDYGYETTNPLPIYLLGGSSTTDSTYFKLGLTAKNVLDVGISTAAKVSATVTIDTNERDEPFILSGSLSDSSLNIYKNETLAGSVATTSKITSFPDAQVFPRWYGYCNDVFLATPAYTDAELQVVRRFFAYFNSFERYRPDIYKTSSYLKEAKQYNFLGGIGNNASDLRKSTQYSITGISADSDGSGNLYGTAPYNELGRAFIFKNGAVDRYSYGNFGGSATASDANYIYYAYGSFANGTITYGVIRVSKTTRLTVDFTSAGTVIPVCTKTGTGFDYQTAITGMTVSGTELFVVDPINAKIKVYDTTTGSFFRDWTPEAAPIRIRKDATGNIWSILANGKVIRYSPTGAIQKTITGLSQPSGIAVNGNTLYVATNDLKTIRVFDVSVEPSVQIGTLGKSLFDSSRLPADIGRCAPGYFRYITDIATDGTNLYVVDCKPLGTDIFIGVQVTSYLLSNFSMNWMCYGHLFTESAGFDDGNVQIVYGRTHKYSINPGDITRNAIVACTINLDKYPNDERIEGFGSNSEVVALAGRRFLITRIQQKLLMHRFNPSTDGEVAIPCVTFDFQNKTYWKDSQGDGLKTLDEISSISFPVATDATAEFALDGYGNIIVIYPSSGCLQLIRLTGFDSFGIPVYRISPIDVIPLPVGDFSAITRVFHQRNKNYLFVGGNKVGTTGSVDIRYMGNKVVRYLYDGITIKKDTELELYTNANSLICDIAGFDDYLFVGHVQDYSFFSIEATSQWRLYDLKQKKLLTKLNAIPTNLDQSWLDINHPFNILQATKDSFYILQESVAGIYNSLYYLSYADVVFDAVTLDFIARIKTQGTDASFAALFPTIVAIDRFVKGCKADGFWDAFLQIYVGVGSSLNEILVSLIYDTVPSNIAFNFTANDYYPLKGLQGGASKYINTGLAINKLAANNGFMSAFVSANTNLNTYGMILGHNGLPRLYTRSDGVTGFSYNNILNFEIATAINGEPGEGLYTANAIPGRNTSWKNKRLISSLTAVPDPFTITQSLFLYAQNGFGTPNVYFDGTISFAAFGKRGLTDAEMAKYYDRVVALQKDLGRA